MNTQVHKLYTPARPLGPKMPSGDGAGETETYPASYGQETLFHIYKSAPASGSANIGLFCKMRGPLDTKLVRAAFDHLVERHPILRTRYSEKQSSVFQTTIQGAGCDFESMNASQWTTETLDNRTGQDSRIPFDPQRGLVFRARLYSLGIEEHLLLLCVHQIAADNRSLAILLDDFEAIYAALCNGRAPKLPVLRRTFFDHAHQERHMAEHEAGRASLDFWSRQLSGDLPVLDLPLDRRRMSRQWPPDYGSLDFQVPPDIMRQLNRLAERERVRLSSVYLTAYGILLSRYGNTQDLLIGSLATTRSGADLNEVVGDFTNFAVIRANYAPALDFCELLRQLSAIVLAVEEHQQLPLPLLTQNLGLPEQHGRAPLCDANFVWDTGVEGIARRRAHHSIQAWAMKAMPPLRAPSDLALTVRACNDVPRPSFLYRKDLFEPGTIKRMSRHFVQLLQAIVSSPETPIGGLDMMPAEERAQVLGSYSGRSADYPRRCLQELFAEQAALHPDSEAVIFGAERLTYRELDQRSNRLAQFLRSQGICHEDRVGIFMDRSIHMIVSMLGIVKAGGAYVPVDPDYPAERLEFIAGDAAVRWVLTARQVHAKLPTPAALVYVAGPDSPIERYSCDPVPNVSTPESVAVIVYTSGSTGQPKAVCIPHRAVVRTVRNTNYVQMTPRDRISQIASPSFDAAIQEIWLALLNGATLVGMRRETLLEPRELLKLLRNERITVLYLPTAFVNQIGREAPDLLKGVRKILFGGEAAETEPVRNILRHVGPGVLVNGYGPAEGCVITTYHEITSIPEDATTVPIGRPVTNAQLYLLDQRMRPVPIGVRGEIYIGGEGVARGYWNRPELNAQRFLPNLFSQTPGALLYRTGDLARMRGDGNLEFLGRMDEQVKIRGHRIELAEVQSAIAAHQDVKQVFVMVREDQPGDKRLVAYVTVHSGLPSAAEALRQHVKDKLPSYMVPASFVILDSIPLNTNGKVDRKALPPPHDRPELETAYREPKTELERILAGVWQDLLGIDKVGVNDNFFKLGGHSLLAVRLIARIEKETGRNIPVTALFEAPTIRQLARKMKDEAYTSTWTPLIALHVPKEHTGAPSLPPVFLVHGAGGNLLVFRDLLPLLPPDQPVYGIQFGEEQFVSGCRELIPQIAARFLTEILAVQPTGPHHFVGHCAGGTLAYEMACQLAEQGHQLPVIVLIDAFRCPFPLRNRVRFSRRRELWKEHLQILLRDNQRHLYLAMKLKRLKRKILHRLRGAVYRSGIARQKMEDEHYFPFNLEEAVRLFKPRAFAGEVHLFRSPESAALFLNIPYDYGWSEVADGVAIHEVPGDHLTLMFEPHAPAIAEKLMSILAERELAIAASRSPVQLQS